VVIKNQQDTIIISCPNSVRIITRALLFSICVRDIVSRKRI
jgi:hypothetical protein